MKRIIKSKCTCTYGKLLKIFPKTAITHAYLCSEYKKSKDQSNSRLLTDT